MVTTADTIDAVADAALARQAYIDAQPPRYLPPKHDFLPPEPVVSDLDKVVANVFAMQARAQLPLSSYLYPGPRPTPARLSSGPSDLNSVVANVFAMQARRGDPSCDCCDDCSTTGNHATPSAIGGRSASAWRSSPGGLTHSPTSLANVNFDESVVPGSRASCAFDGNVVIDAFRRVNEEFVLRLANAAGFEQVFAVGTVEGADGSCNLWIGFQNFNAERQGRFAFVVLSPEQGVVRLPDQEEFRQFVVLDGYRVLHWFEGMRNTVALGFPRPDEAPPNEFDPNDHLLAGDVGEGGGAAPEGRRSAEDLLTDGARIFKVQHNMSMVAYGTPSSGSLRPVASIGTFSELQEFNLTRILDRIEEVGDGSTELATVGLWHELRNESWTGLIPFDEQYQAWRVHVKPSAFVGICPILMAPWRLALRYQYRPIESFYRVPRLSDATSTTPVSFAAAVELLGVALSHLELVFLTDACERGS